MAKLYLVLGFLLVGIGQISALSEEMEKLANLLHKQCTEETNVSEDAIINARLGIFAEDPALKCYMKCVMIASTIMDEDGRIYVEAIMGLIPEPYKPLVRPIAEKCASVSGVDICEKAFQANVCFQNDGPAYYYLA